MDQAATQTSSQMLRILLLEDSALDAELVTEALSESGLAAAIERVVLEEDFARALHEGPWDLVLADYLLPGFNGLSALALVRESHPELPFVFVSGALGEEVAVEALKRGATDYVLKDRLDRLPVTVSRALAEARERSDKLQAQQSLQKLLDERTALLHELDHRVKNNLQLLLSLIGIEIRHAEDETTGRVLERMKERLQALGAAQRDLYNRNGSSRFDVSSFAKGLCEELTETGARSGIAAEFDIEAIEMEANKAAPIALLFNEIIVNALTHAYHERHGKLKLALRVRDRQLLFQLSDDAFTPEEKQAAQDGASGTVLKGLAHQLDASVEWPKDDPKVLVRVFMPTQEVG
jgi:two-component sensor histidine kinase